MRNALRPAIAALLLGATLAVGAPATPAAADGDPGDGYASFAFGKFDSGYGQSGTTDIPKCGPNNINGRTGGAKWSVGTSVANGDTITVGETIDLTATVFGRSPGPLPNDGPNPLVVAMPVTGAAVQQGDVLGDFPKGDYLHPGDGPVGPLGPSNAPFGYRFDVNSSPKGLFQPGDGAWVRVRATLRATAPGTIALDELRVSGFDATPIASDFACSMDLPFSWKVRAPKQPTAGTDIAATDANHPYVSFGDANGGEHGIAIDVLANDEDPESGGGLGDTSEVRIKDWQPESVAGGAVSCGTAQQKGTGSFGAMSTGPCTYRPPAGFSGTDSFAYVVRSVTGLERTGKAFVNVRPNRAPVVGQPEYFLNSAQQIVDASLSPVIDDADDDPVACSLVDGPPGLDVDQGCTFDFDPQGSGQLTFTIRVCDTHTLLAGGQFGASTTPLPGYAEGSPDDLSATTSRRCADRDIPITVTEVNDALRLPPVAGLDTDVVDTGYAADGIGAFSLDLPVLDNDIDPNGPDPADANAWTGTLAILEGPGTAGTATVLGGPTGRLVRFTPADGYSGPVTFTYRVCEDPAAQDPPYADDPDTPIIDEGLPLCGVGTVSLEVLPNEAPIAGDDAVTTTSTDPVVGFDVGANDVDPEAQALTCSPGPLTAAPDGLVAAASIGADCAVTVTPAAGATGIATLPYEVCDTHTLADPDDPANPYGANGEVPGGQVSRCSTAQLEVTIVAPADDQPDDFDLDPAPTCLDDAATSDGGAVTVEVLANDSDVDLNGDPSPLTVVYAGLVDAPDTSEAGGSIAIAADGADLTYTPPVGFSGTDTFFYTAQDTNGKGCSAEVTVVATNDDPPTDGAPNGTSGSDGADNGAGSGTLARTGPVGPAPLLLVVIGAIAVAAGAAVLAARRLGSGADLNR